MRTLVHKDVRIIVDGRELASEITKRGLRSGFHFDRDGTRLCSCCELTSLSQKKYERIRQLNLDGKTFLVLCSSFHGMTRYDDDGKVHFSGMETEVFSPAVLETARIFEIDRTRLNRKNLVDGQRVVEGEERQTLIRRILNNEGALLTIARDEQRVGDKFEALAYYLGDEEKPKLGGGKVYGGVA